MSVAEKRTDHLIGETVNSEQFIKAVRSYAFSPYGVEAFRRLALELAFKGKLTDESSVPFSEWRVRAVKDIATTMHPGSACGKQHQVPNGHVHLRTHNVSTNGSLNFDLLIRVDPNKIDPKKAKLRRGDIIFNNTNSQELVGKTCLVDRDYDYAFSNHLTLIRLKDDVDAGFFVRYFGLLLTNGYFFDLCNRWIGQAGISTKALKLIEVPLPPLAEQRRIVAKVDRLTELCDRLESERAEVLSLTDRSRRSVLSSPTRSRDASELSSAWRRLSDHFEILHDRPETLTDLRQTILQLAVQGKLVKQDPEHCERTTKTIEDVVGRRNLKNGLSLKQTSDPTDYLGLRLSAMRGGEIDCSDGKPIAIGAERAEPYLIQRGDVFIMRGNGSTDLVGRAGIVREQPDKVIFPDLFIRCPLDPNVFDSEYFLIAWNSPSAREMILERARTTSGIWKVNQGHIASMSFEIPPIAEQIRIVARVDRLLSQCDHVAEQLRQQQATTEKLLTAAIDRILEHDNQ